jgi:hypothetical protein
MHGQPVLSEAHLDWCYNHYRSYREETDSYTAYSGQTKRCVSPYSDGIASDGTASTDGEDPLYPAPRAGGGDMLTVDHVRDCFDRYRSYRIEDNSYQPYGGGPRQQCQ